METRDPSPDGKYIFQIFPWEAGMSLWVETPRLLVTESGACVLHFENRNWSFDDALWLDAEKVKLWLRRYPGDHRPAAFEVLIDCECRRATVRGGEPIALDFLENVLEAEYVRGRYQAFPTEPVSLSWRQRLLAALKRWFD